MKRIYVLVFCVVSIFVLGGQISAQTQMTVTENMYQTDRPKMLPIDKDHAIFYAVDEAGVFVTNNGKGPFNNLAARCVWIDSHDPAKDHWYCFAVTTDSDGDNIFWELREGASPNSGYAKILWGSGKFEGIEGDTEFVQTAKNFPDGTRLVISLNQVWKLTLKKPLP